MSAGKKAIGYVVPHTHWDREWRYPIWRTRLHLVRFMDKLLEILDSDSDYRCFVLDGQSVMVEDYLEVKPEKKTKIRKYIKEGRIKVGPWYTLPDLFPVDGECLLRNLLKGIRYSKELGGQLEVGFTTFGWGQIAQFPQIYAGFGIDFIIAGKNVSKKRAPEMEFLWESPDGTRLLTTRLGKFARANFFMNAYLPIRFGKKYTSDEYGYEWGRGGTVIHKATEEGWHEDYFKIIDETGYYPHKIKEAVRAAWEATDDTKVKDLRLLLNGSDSTTPQPILSRLIKDANKVLEDIELIHGTLEEYAKELKRQLKLEELKVVKGELRDGPAYACAANALSTRIHIKQLNRGVENTLIKRAEPFASILAMRGGEYPSRLLTIAWKYLLLSQAHDSINGVTQDKTAADTLYRLNQALEIGEVIFDKKAVQLVKSIALSHYAEDEVLLVAVNPYPRPVRRVVKICVDTPRDKNIWNIAITDFHGHKMAVQPVSRREKIVPVDDIEARPWPFHVDRHIVYMDTGEVPPGGYKVFRVCPKEDFNRNIVFWPEVRTSSGNDISPLPHILENEFLRAEIRPNGTIDLIDKSSGRSFQGIHYFEDTGDVGDYWVYYPPYENQTYTSIGANARIWQEDNGPLSATIGLEIKMDIPRYARRPERGIVGESRRSEELTTITIISYITLCRGAKHLKIKTEVQNTAEDHRFRVMFPTRIPARYSHAAGHFNVDRRPTEPVRDKDGQFYPDMQTYPQQSFVDISDGEYGFAVINRSFTEYEAVRDEHHTLAITLFRSVRNIIATEFRSAGEFPHQKGGQLLQTLEYEYALYPHKGDWKEGLLLEEAGGFNVPVSVYQISPHSYGTLPEEASLYSIEPENLMLSCFKLAEDRSSYILRLYNPTEEMMEGKISLATKVKKAFACTLNEVRIEELEIIQKGEIPISVPKGRIFTVELEL